MSAVESPRQVSLKQAAFLLGCCTKTLYRMYDDGQIKFTKLRGRTFVPMTEVDRLTQPTQQTVGEPVGEPKILRPKKVQLYPQLV